MIKNDDSHAPLRVARDQACPFAAAGHDSGRVEDAFKSAAWGAVLVWWACWRDMFKFWHGRCSLSLRPAFSDSSESYVRSSSSRPSRTLRGRPTSPWWTASRRI